MDADSFDRIVKSISAGGTRRGVLRFLSALPFAGALATLPVVEAEPGRWRKRRKTPRRHGNVKVEKRHKKKKKKKCKPQSTTQTCAGKYGTMLNNCKKAIDCGACLCASPCPVCQACNVTAGECEPDPGQQAASCGQPGQICQSDGVCACDAGSCAACETCLESGFCSVPCGGSGCCDGAICQAGDASAACGTNGETCQVCGNPTALCVNTACAACSQSNPCPAGQLCVDGACEPCDVCANGCPFDSVQGAINDIGTLDGDTIFICPGAYGKITINKSITLIGAGNGENAASNTIVDAIGVGRVVFIDEDVSATLRKMRITGGALSDQGAGMYHQGAILTMTECTVSGNTSIGNSGGGMFITPGRVLSVTSCTVSGNTATGAGDGGGIYNDGGTVTLTATDVSGNTPNNCAGDAITGCND